MMKPPIRQNPTSQADGSPGYRRRAASRVSMDSYRLAHRIAFAPLTFQAVRIARDRGLLKAAQDAGCDGISPADGAAATKLSLYAVNLLLQSCLSLDLLAETHSRFHLTSAGWIVLNDPLVTANMNFTHDVCYQGAFALEQSLLDGMPLGLKVFGDWQTIYEGLTQLPEHVQKSWFGFDHIYSDTAFADCLEVVFSRRPAKLLDVGGNTGRWAITCTAHDSDVVVTILDHANQLLLAQRAAEAANCAERVQCIAMDLLAHSTPFPPNMDAIWMSQLLDCFGESDILQLLERGRHALNADGRLYILETYWDRQPNLSARDSIIATSLYFACMANGNSRMYHSEDMRRLVADAGLSIAAERQIGFHTLIECV